MKKIGFIITKSQIGGAQKFVLDQISLLNEKYDITLITNESGWLTDEIKYFKINTYLDNRIEKLNSIFFLFNLTLFLKKNKIDLIICNSANAGIYGRLASLFAFRKSIYISHGWSSNYNSGTFKFFFNKIEYLFSLITNKIICVSENDYFLAKDKLKISPSKLICLSNSIIPFKFILGNKIIRNKVNLLTVCRLENPKRVDLIIEAIKNNRNITFNIVGGGNQLNFLSSIIENEKILNVNFLGEIRPFKDFSNYDIFILISESEGLPISAIEAMSCNLPLVLSNVGGCGELINNNGILVENNSDSISNGINKVITNLEFYSQGSTAHFNNSFNLHNKIFLYYELYNEVLGISKT